MANLDSHLNRTKFLQRHFGFCKEANWGQLALLLFISAIVTVLALKAFNSLLLRSIDLAHVEETSNQTNAFPKLDATGMANGLTPIRIEYNEATQTLIASVGRASSNEAQLVACRKEAPEPVDRINLNDEAEATRISEDLAAFWQRVNSPAPTGGGINPAKAHGWMLANVADYRAQYGQWVSATGAPEKQSVIESSLGNSQIALGLRTVGAIEPKRYCISRLIRTQFLTHFETFSPIGSVLRAYEESMRFGVGKEGIICGVTRNLDESGRRICQITRSIESGYAIGLDVNSRPLSWLGLVNGPFQFATMLAFWWLMLVAAARRLAAVTSDCGLTSIRTYRDGKNEIRMPWEIASGSIEACHSNVDRLVLYITNKWDSNVLPFSFVTLAAYQTALSIFNQTQKLSDVPTALEAVREGYKSRAEAVSSVTEYLIWLIPTTGFLGTIYGISESLRLVPLMQSPDPVVIAFARIGIGDAVGIAFDTTFLALAVSVVAVLVERWTRGSINLHVDYAVDNVWWKLAHPHNVQRPEVTSEDNGHDSQPSDAGSDAIPQDQNRARRKKGIAVTIIVVMLVLLIAAATYEPARTAILDRLLSFRN